ncbi:DUF4446 family protein [Cellulosilyticum sp. I15G10I2]|uniref:DUF4446 family protein n=1 Tax=Cellulosilyticum sp. I15G10I2 TaxID=1892843 RepID=UPI001FA7FC0E|nr:DUF4446 family protein [Cellulosilyticum sp. I15G10I2]
MILLLNNYLLYIVLGLSVFTLILFILLIVNYSKMKKIQRRYEKFMSKEDVDLEELLVQYTKKLNILLQNEKDIFTKIKEIEDIQSQCIQKVGVVRYKAIANTGADLSFAIALLDQQNDGVVLNGIYSRDGSYTYAKPIQDAKSTYTLSEEEQQALQKAINKRGM